MCSDDHVPGFYRPTMECAAGYRADRWLRGRRPASTGEPTGVAPNGSAGCGRAGRAGCVQRRAVAPSSPWPSLATGSRTRSGAAGGQRQPEMPVAAWRRDASAGRALQVAPAGSGRARARPRWCRAPRRSPRRGCRARPGRRRTSTITACSSLRSMTSRPAAVDIEHRQRRVGHVAGDLAVAP